MCTLQSLHLYCSVLLKFHFLCSLLAITLSCCWVSNGAIVMLFAVFQGWGPQRQNGPKNTEVDLPCPPAPLNILPVYEFLTLWVLPPQGASQKTHSPPPL